MLNRIKRVFKRYSTTELQNSQAISILEKQRDQILGYLYEEQAAGVTEYQVDHIRLIDALDNLKESIKKKGYSKEKLKNPLILIEEMTALSESHHNLFQKMHPDKMATTAENVQQQKDAIQFRTFLEANQKLPLLEKTKNIWSSLKLILKMNLPKKIHDELALHDRLLGNITKDYETALQDREQDAFGPTNFKIIDYHHNKIKQARQALENATLEVDQLLIRYFYGWGNNTELRNKWETAIAKQKSISISKPTELGELPPEAKALQINLAQYFDKHQAEIAEYFLLLELADLLRDASHAQDRNSASVVVLKTQLNNRGELKRVLEKTNKLSQLLDKDSIEKALQTVANRSTAILRKTFNEGQNFCDPQSLLKYSEAKIKNKSVSQQIYHQIFVHEAQRKKEKANQELIRANRELTQCNKQLDTSLSEYNSAKNKYGFFKRLFSFFFPQEKSDFRAAQDSLKSAQKACVEKIEKIESIKQKIKTASDYELNIKRTATLGKSELTTEATSPGLEAETSKTSKILHQLFPNQSKSEFIDFLSISKVVSKLENSLNELGTEEDLQKASNPELILIRLTSEIMLMNKFKKNVKDSKLLERIISVLDTINNKIEILKNLKAETEAKILKSKKPGRSERQGRTST